MHKLVTLLALSVILGAPRPREAAPTEWPLERIVENLSAHLVEHPEDGVAHYNLGRAYAFAFALDRSTVRVYPGDWALSVADLDRQNRRLHEQHEKDVSPRRELSVEERLDCLAKGVTHLDQACELFPREARFQLTRAWLLETGASFASDVDSTALFHLPQEALSAERQSELRILMHDLGAVEVEKSEAARVQLMLSDLLEAAVPELQKAVASDNTIAQAAARELLKRFWTERAIATYWVAFELAAAKEEEQQRVANGRGRILPEPLDSYRRLVDGRGLTDLDRSRLELAEKRLAVIEAMPHSRYVTPLLLSLREGCPSLDELTAPNLSVPFDLDGDALDELWPWLAADAGWLVWDPEQRGEITSGLQLFGSASAWLFFADGYRVLDALDDDRDGELRNEELTGIAVWFDRDTDGVSDKGEVVPIEELGIVALATEATESIGASLGNQGGAELADGRRLPTYDWVLAPAQP